MFNAFALSALALLGIILLRLTRNGIMLKVMPVFSRCICKA